MGALVGLTYVARMSAEAEKSKTHPPVSERIRLLFERVGNDPAASFWTFAIALMWGLKPAIAFAPVAKKEQSERDLAVFALGLAFQEA